ncbi:MAG: acyl-CoA dehydrogenase [Desulfamplus sp.]|nr:acyl-CoA dehydrogenase [Desulfamplus sp.]
MAGRFINMRNLKFTLHELMESHKTSTCDPFGGRNKKSIDLVLDAALEFSKKALHPIFETMDRNPPELKNGTVAVNPEVRNIMQTLGKDGWIAAPFPEKWGGEEMPATLFHAVYFIFAAANYSGSVYSGLTTGAAKLILTYGSEHLKNTFLPPMLDGKWQGTMALTEPEAGSSLGDLITSAKPLKQYQNESNQDDQLFLISGEKIFISAGDHDGVDNIVHLLLARIEGSPSGVKGISLFVVPKFRVEKDDSGKDKLVMNDVTVTQTFHKLGYRGAPITALSFGDKGDCRGWLVGEPNKGLSYMFQMMNGARLEVGMGATSIAAAAYEAALDYTKQRKQGRRISDGKKNSGSKGDLDKSGKPVQQNEPIPIIEHLDVKRMLLFQRAVWEGSLSLILQCSIYEDIAKNIPHDQIEEKKRYHLLLELLTPIAKTFPSEMGILATSQSIQCFGGYGYCEDFPVEQHFRDMRIHAIHEGTTGIQAMDLLGRKVVMQDGKALKLFCSEVQKTIEKTLSCKNSDLVLMADELSQSLKILVETTQSLGTMAFSKGAEAYLGNAALYLEMFGYVVIAWQWLSQALIANNKLTDVEKGIIPNKSDRLFYEGKILVSKYYFCHELPKIKYLQYTLTNSVPISMSVTTEHFTIL